MSTQSFYFVELNFHFICQCVLFCSCPIHKRLTYSCLVVNSSCCKLLRFDLALYGVCDRIITLKLFEYLMLMLFDDVLAFTVNINISQFLALYGHRITTILNCKMYTHGQLLIVQAKQVDFLSCLSASVGTHTLVATNNSLLSYGSGHVNTLL